MLKNTLGRLKMSTYTAAQASPFTRAVVNSMRKLYAIRAAHTFRG